VGFECGNVVLERKERESGKGRKVRRVTRGKWNVVLKKSYKLVSAYIVNLFLLS